jgi:hypothetical protein
MKKIVEVTIGFNVEKEEIEYIKSDFMEEKNEFKDGIGYTAQLIEMGLEKWIREKIGIFCPECSIELQEEWTFCPNCGWGNSKE